MSTIFWNRASWEPEELERAACALCPFAKTFPKLRQESKGGGNIPTDWAGLLSVLSLISCSSASFQPLCSCSWYFLMAITGLVADQMQVRLFKTPSPCWCHPLHACDSCCCCFSKCLSTPKVAAIQNSPHRFFCHWPPAIQIRGICCSLLPPTTPSVLSQSTSSICYFCTCKAFCLQRDTAQYHCCWK